jgi:hypothetical protein
LISIRSTPPAPEKDARTVILVGSALTSLPIPG